MCGFLGVAVPVGAKLPEDTALVAARDTLFHRGPDDGRIARGRGGAIAFRRLSIVDLDGGAQPFVLEDGALLSCTNGEIYNHTSVRAELEAQGVRFRSHSDCEVVPHLVARGVRDFPTRLLGMFASCAIDARSGRTRLLLARDRLGIKPLHFALEGGALWFASEPKALLAMGVGRRRLRGAALVDFLAHGYVGGDDTAFEGIRRLPPGTLLEWEEGWSEPRLTRYWRPPVAPREEHVPGERILELLDDAVGIRLMADVPLGAFLSGGIDSTAVVDAMTRRSKDPIVACSVGFRERSHDELDTARRTAQRLGLVHHTSVLEAEPAGRLDELAWFFDEPHADPSNVPTLLVSRAAREHVTVALSGDGGDEIFAGYRRYVHDVAENRLRRGVGAPGRALARALGSIYPKLDRAPRFLRAKTFLTNLGDDPARAYHRSVSQLTLDEVRDVLAPDARAALAQHDPFDRFARAYGEPETDDALFRAQYADFATQLPEQILTKVDRASMGVGLEVRVPILDHRMVELGLALPAGDKVRGGRGKHAFREALRPRVPSDVLDGRKRGFDTPLRAWLRGPLAEVARAAVEEVPAAWFDRAALRARLAEHASGARDRSRLLWSVIVLSHWRRVHRVEEDVLLT
ncbi:MAG: asparagine synthase (glutamine-hydrolyzing) [Planctomycetota bacterium]